MSLLKKRYNKDLVSLLPCCYTRKICIFFGKTPASASDKPRAASKTM
ncbi:MAG TPA: hypothetical protein VJH95_03120 [Candidatus Nanoarchaeia archaeon]|nr:hypothetical protein [Candidatus Nanoarchaeia archaeon]